MYRHPILCLVPFLAACSSLQFQQTSLVDTAYDPALKATRLKVQFQVHDASGLPVSDLEPDNLILRENGVPTGSEAMVKTTRQQHPIDVAVLLDRSRSAYEIGLVPQQKELARRFAKGLEKQPTRIHFYSFATTLTQLKHPDELADKAPKDAEHWTSLYHCVQQALDRHPSGIVVVFSDGADNYSHNVGGPTLGKLAERIRADKRIVHAIGFGSIEREHDINGIDGDTALRTLTVYGSFARATGKAEPAKAGDKAAVEATASRADPATIVDPMVVEVARRIPTTYTCEFYSPRLTGEHSVQVEADRNGVRGSSPALKFKGAGPEPVPPAK